MFCHTYPSSVRIQTPDVEPPERSIASYLIWPPNGPSIVRGFATDCVGILLAYMASVMAKMSRGLRNSKALFAALLLMSAIGCEKKIPQGVLRIQLPWQTDNGGFALQEIEVKTLDNVEEARGTAADIYMDPVNGEQGLDGRRPIIKYLESEDRLIVPKDFFSTQVLGLYAHTEKLWELDKKVGAGELLPRPRKIGFGARERTGQVPNNNAVYLKSSDATVFFPYDGSSHSDYEQLPLTLNPGVIAHEHFHGLFRGAVKFGFEAMGGVAGCQNPHIVPRPQVQFRIANWNDFFLLALDEGLADVWGWIYSGNPRFLDPSIPGLKTVRFLDHSTSGPVRTKSSFSQERGSPDGFARESVYELGTYIARRIRNDSMKAANSADTSQFRLQLAGHLIQSLKRFPGFLESAGQKGQSEIEIEPVIIHFTLPSTQEEVKP